MICRKKWKMLMIPKMIFCFIFVISFWLLGEGGEFLEKIKIFIEVFSLKLRNLVK